MTEASRDIRTGGDGGGDDRREPLWNVRQTAKYFQVSVDTIYRRCASGEMPHAKLGGVLRFSPARLREYAERLHAESEPGSNVVRLQAARNKGRR